MAYLKQLAACPQPTVLLVVGLAVRMHTLWRETTIVPWGGLSHRMFTSIFGRNFAIGAAHEGNALGERARSVHFPVGYQFIGPARGRTAVLGTELPVAVQVDEFLHAPADLL